jgi:RNA polymerase sigma-70 factor (ECF subfamily)
MLNLPALSTVVAVARFFSCDEYNLTRQQVDGLCLQTIAYTPEQPCEIVEPRIQDVTTMISSVLTAEKMDAQVAHRSLDLQQQMDLFLRQVEGRAFRMTVMQVSDADEALDIVQDSMIRLARRYAKRSPEEWPPLFFRILQNRTKDYFRRQAIRRRIIGFFSRDNEVHEEQLANAPGPESDNPLDALERGAAMTALQDAMKDLPERQREAFMLRNFEGLDVRDTAAAMGCSQGSVKTHYSRAVARLRERLGDHWS